MMEHNTFDKLIKEAMALDAMDMPEPDAALVSSARNRILARKKPAPEKTGFYDWLLALVKGRLKFYQLGFSVLVTCLCVFYSFEISVNNHSSQGLSNYNAAALSIKNNTISVNSSTILTCIPTLRN